MNYLLLWSQLSTFACMTYVHNKFNFEKSYEMVRRWWFDLCYGWVQRILWHVINPWCHRCYVIPSAKVEGPIFYNQLLFLQIKRLQNSKAPSKEVSRCICWDSRFYQWCSNFENVFFYHKTTKQNLFSIDLDKKVSNLILWGTRTIPCCHGWWCRINIWKYITLCLIFCIINNYFMAKMWLKFFLDPSTKDFKQELLQQTNLNIFFCQMLSSSITCYLTWSSIVDLKMLNPWWLNWK